MRFVGLGLPRRAGRCEPTRAQALEIARALGDGPSCCCSTSRAGLNQTETQAINR